MRLLLLRPAAAGDIDQAYRWYEGQRIGLGEEFLLEVRTTLWQLREQPDACPVIHRDTRRALLKRFPYGVFYRVFEQQIVVVACLHARRHPRHWRRG